MAATCIIVAGMHRSGTSATAGALGLCGVEMGNDLLAPGADNPKGYFEHERAVAINERLLAALGSRWDDVRALPAGWQDGEAAREALAAIDAFIGAEFGDAPLWALKDPRLCRLLPLWLVALRRRGVRPVVLFVARDPAEVCASIQARNGWAAPASGIAWLRHMLEAEAASRDLSRTAIAYDALLADPARSLGEALARLDVALPRPPDAAALRRFVDAGDRHQHRDALQPPRGPFAPLIGQVHDALARVAAGEDAWASIRDANQAFEREWTGSGAAIDAVAGMAARFDADARAARAATLQVRSELNAQLQWARQAVAKEEGLQAERARLQSELTAQVRWSEQAVADWAARTEGYEQQLSESRAVLEARESELAAMRQSLSWRITRPLRALRALSKRITRKSTPR